MLQCTPFTRDTLKGEEAPGILPQPLGAPHLRERGPHHGFGLHISALTAAEMKGQLRGTSPGLGLGATFSLELPLQVEQAQAAL